MIKFKTSLNIFVATHEMLFSLQPPKEIIPRRGHKNWRNQYKGVAFLLVTGYNSLGL